MHEGHTTAKLLVVSVRSQQSAGLWLDRSHNVQLIVPTIDAQHPLDAERRRQIAMLVRIVAQRKSHDLHRIIGGDRDQQVLRDPQRIMFKAGISMSMAHDVWE